MRVEDQTGYIKSEAEGRRASISALDETPMF